VPRLFRRDAPEGGARGRGGSLQSAAASDVSDEQERHILAALADLRDTTVSEVMTPRVDVVGLPIPVHSEDVARAVRESGHSCFPVYDDDIDNLVGVLYVNDLFRAGSSVERPSAIDISRRLRQPYLVPESRRVLDVLAEMRRVRRTFAVVVDEYGGVAGVMTVKDLLAALVGDLYDEFDPGGEPEVVRVDRNRWLVDGGASIDDVRSQMGLDLPEGKYVTLGGYIFDALGHIPVEGERLNYEGWELRIVEMDKRRVAKVVVVQPEAEESGKNGGGTGRPEREADSAGVGFSGSGGAGSGGQGQPG
jgi:CBS domain containing-hemolysin-like protein